jgi:hypothetical protein
MTSLPKRKTLQGKTDHDSLNYFLEKQLSLEEKQKWVTKMIFNEFEIIYKIW